MRKYLQIILKKGFVSRICKELTKFNKKSILLEYEQKTWTFTTKNIHIAKCMNICSTSLAITEMQINGTMRCHYVPIRITEIKNK